MTTKTIQMYRTNLDGSETTLYPLTEAKYVTMDDGTTIEEALTNSDSSKYSPVIESSKAVFKVGEGDSVDLSESAIDGAYNSCVLKGKTMVNCIQEPSSQDVVLPYEFEDGQYVTINDTKESGALGVELKGQTLVNLVTKTWAMGYTAQFNKDTITLTANTDKAWFSTTLKTVGMKAGGTYLLYTDSITYDASLSSSSNLASLVSLYEMKPNRNVGRFISNGAVKVTIPSDVDASDIGIRIHATLEEGTGGVGKTITVKGLKIIEYQQGMENWDIPYFEGMASCKMPILTTIGKNLLNLSSDTLERLTINGSTGVIVEGNTRCTTKYIKATPKDDLFLKRFNTDYQVAVRYYYNDMLVNRTLNGNGNFISDGNLKVDSNDYYNQIRLIFAKNNNSEVTPQEVSSQQIMLTSSQDDIFEPYKTSILSLPEEVVLRSLPNGVCDTFNVHTGEYVQRIGERVLDGTYNWSSYREGFHTDDEWYQATAYGLRIAKDLELNMICDKLKAINNLVSVNASPQECITSYRDETGSYTDGNAVFVCVKKATIGATTITECKTKFQQWIANNPLTIQYKLETPIVTKINLSSTLKPWNTTTHVYSEIPENTLYPILSHSNPTYPVILKPSTKYSIVANSYSNNHTNSAINFNLGGATASTTVGSRVTTITTPSTLTSEELVMSGRGNKLNNVMVIEGDVAGDEPYFEGICDVKSPILSNVGKNLFTIKNGNRPVHPNHSIVAMGDNHINITSITDEVGWIYTTYEIKGLKPNTTYILSAEISEGVNNSSGSRGTMLIHDFKMNVSSPVVTSSNKVIRYTTPTDISDIGLLFYSSRINTPNKVGDTYDFKNIHLQIEQANTDYEPYKSNTTTFNQKDDKTIVLRSLPSGVCDTLNVETGEYVQRIGEVVLDGEIGMWLYPHQVRENTLENAICFQTVDISDMSSRWGSANMIYCDKLHYGNNNFGDPIESTYWGCSTNIISRMNKQLVICIDKTETNVNNQNELVNWLKSNPLTVQYKLETPIVSTIDVQGFPYAYTNGHVQLSSGSIEQSLTPKVEYSLVANRNGQIEANTKSIRRHQDKLDDFEALMLTQMIQTHYEKTLLQFDFEMQMMALGGE